MAYFVADLSMHAWLSLEALRIWLEHGPGRTLLGPASHAAFAAVELRGDYAAGVPGAAADRGAGRGPRLRARDLTGALPVRCS